MCRYHTPAHHLPGPSVVDSYVVGTYQVPSGQQLSQWAAHRSALSTAVAEHPVPRRRRASRAARAAVAQTA